MITDKMSDMEIFKEVWSERGGSSWLYGKTYTQV